MMTRTLGVCTIASMENYGEQQVQASHCHEKVSLHKAGIQKKQCRHFLHKQKCNKFSRENIPVIKENCSEGATICDRRAF